MTSLFRSRHDADELHDALSGTAAPGVAERHADLLRTVSLLTSHEPVAPRPDFSADLRERLMAAAATELVAAPAPERAARVVAPAPARRRLATAVASLVVVGGTAGMAAAAQGALPGDPLYPIKRGGEEVAAVVRPGPDGAAELRQAMTRLDEAAALQQRDADSALVASTIDDFRTSGEQGAGALLAQFRADGDPAGVGEVREFAAAALPRLDDLAAVDPTLEPAVLQAADVLAALDGQARSLCSTCGPTGALSLPAAFGEGAAAASLSSLLVGPAQQARLDARTLSGLDPEQVADLGRAAESQAGAVVGDDWPVLTETARGPVGSTLTTSEGGLTETVTGTVRGATGAVDGLVGGLRDTVGTVGSAVPRDNVVGGTVGGLTDTVDQALQGVSGVTGSLTGN